MIRSDVMIAELLLAKAALAEALLLLMGRRREYMQRQNFGANSPPAHCWLFFLHGKSLIN